MSKTTDFGQGITLTDWEEPERLDGAQMQFMVTNESGRMGSCLAYFGTREDAEIFVKAKISKSQIEERSDEVSAADQIASLTHKIESLRADLANCERRAEEAEARNDFFRTILDLPAEDIAEIRDALAKKVKK